MSNFLGLSQGYGSLYNVDNAMGKIADDTYLRTRPAQDNQYQIVFVKFFIGEKSGSLLATNVLDEIKRFVSAWMAVEHPFISKCLELVDDLSSSPAVIIPYSESTLPLGDSLKLFQNNFLHKISFMQKIAEALAFLHSKDIVHGAIHPGNILVVDGEPSLTIGNKFEPGRCSIDAGRWTAPEIYRAETIPVAYSQQSDVYSIGMLIYYLVTETAPFHGKKQPALLLKIVSEGLRPERPVNCSDGLWSLLVECWSEVPNNRPTATQVESALHELSL